jgi:raffinose/stachyose/melibiose transport system substrate-binding protein
MVEDEFNETHDDIHLTISSPNDAMTILRTRFIREDYPDIIGIGGDINYSYFVDAEILADVTDYEGLNDIKQAYRDIDESLELVPTEGTYALPYVANAAGILYNKDMFEEYGWTVPQNWEELIALCEEIQSEGILPFYFGFKDTWTCLAPWNAMAVDLAPADTAKQVNRGETTFTAEYREVAEKYLELLQYGPSDPFAYGYNDACTAFARGESAMYTIGSYAAPQILSVNPEMNLDSFVMPASDDGNGNTLNSGIDLQFCVTADCKNKEAAYEVLDFLYADENIQKYIDAQTAIPCKEGDFELPSILDGMAAYIDAGNMTDYQDHYYPSEMAVDAQIQTFLIKKDVDAFLSKFDTDWQRYNRDIIRMVQDYEEKNATAE